MSNDSLSYLTKYFYKKPEEVKQKEVLELRSFLVDEILSSKIITKSNFKFIYLKIFKIQIKLLGSLTYFNLKNKLNSIPNK